jgi:hypothetical protein
LYSVFLSAFVAAVTFGPSHSNYAWRLGPNPGVCTLDQDVPTGGTLEVSKPIGRGTSIVAFKNGDSADETTVEVQDANVFLSPTASFSGDARFRMASSRRPPNWIAVEIADPAFLTRFAASTSVTLANPRFGQITIPVRAADAAAQALVSCEQTRLRDWGIDPAAWQGLRSRPTPLNSPATWLNSANYPYVGVMYGVGAYVVALLTVNADGTVQSCKGLNQNVPEDFNSNTCYALKRHARFHPAIDASGHPTSAPYIVAIQYMIGR